MRCDEIQERFIDLLYEDEGARSASPDLHGHLASCPSCRQELERLRQVRETLQIWQDEQPLKPGAPLRTPAFRKPARPLLQYARYAAMAAMVLLAFMALANAEMSWDDGGFSFRTQLLPGRESGSEFYTKEQMREILKQVLDDSEARMYETNVLMMQRMLETIERDRWMDMRLIRDQFTGERNRN